MIALLLPAVQAAREAARRLQCSNNLKQLGLACLNYEAAKGAFPPSSQWDTGYIDHGNHNRYGANWVVLILPYLEQQSLYDAMSQLADISDPAGVALRGTQLSVMLCPTDANNRQPFNGSAGGSTNQMGDNWARGNYAANAALGLMNEMTNCCDYGNGVMSCAAGPASSYGWRSNRLRGVMGANVSVGIAEIRDGTSNTLLLAEIRAGLFPCDLRGCWALGGPPSALWGHGSFMGDLLGPNSAAIGGDNINGCDAVLATVGCSDWTNCPALERDRMSCFPWTWSNQQGAKSMHAGGVHACFADGSVHWISDYIDTVGDVTANPPLYSIWDRLNLSADGAPVSGEF